MKDSNRGLRRFYQTLICAQLLLIASGVWLIHEGGNLAVNLSTILMNLLFLGWNVTILMDLKKEAK